MVGSAVEKATSMLLKPEPARYKIGPGQIKQSKRKPMPKIEAEQRQIQLMITGATYIPGEQEPHQQMHTGAMYEQEPWYQDQAYMPEIPPQRLMHMPDIRH